MHRTSVFTGSLELAEARGGPREYAFGAAGARPCEIPAAGAATRTRSTLTVAEVRLMFAKRDAEVAASARGLRPQFRMPLTPKAKPQSTSSKGLSDFMKRRITDELYRDFRAGW